MDKESFIPAFDLEESGRKSICAGAAVIDREENVQFFLDSYVAPG